VDRYPPVRHWRFKSRKRPANALSTKVIERAIEMTTRLGELVLGPFAGSGTTYTYAVCEARDRHCIGIELDSCSATVERLQRPAIENHRNDDVVDEFELKVTPCPAEAD
jgi:site-specific DNA-methyltransferase (adenine-specific)